MILGLAVKMVATAVVVIVITVSVAHLGPRIGGILVGTPIVLGPAFYFLAREQSAAFVAQAAVSTLHALAASLVFLMCYVVTSGRHGAWPSAMAAVASWAVAAAAFGWLPGGLLPALVLYGIVFSVALVLERRLRLPEARTRAKAGWGDLVVRGAAAGLLVGVATTIGARVGPALSGTLAGFPVGFLVVSLTLHQRYGAPVARATLVTAQRGMLSLLAFATAMAALAPVVGGAAFPPALAASLLVSALMVVASWLAARRG